jgi:hypothetical protein
MSEWESWQSAETAPEEEIIWTKIDDENGVRNVAPLKRSGILWYVPDGSMYVYYTPTHWTRRRRSAQKQQAAELPACSRASWQY